MEKSPNRLIKEKSLYLRQHAYNPVDWYPWDEEAFKKAQKEDKPLFISIGYSSCHWCHVMEKESFEDPEIAEILNKYFVPIKVDREERPDVDAFYMDACIALNGNGGWPLTVFATPDKKPFFVGTYFPKESKWGRPGLKELLLYIAELWQNDREKLLNSVEKIVEALKERRDYKNPTPVKLDETVLHAAFEQLKAIFDEAYGGFGEAPKFPTPHKLLFLARYYYKYKNPEGLLMLEKTLTKMALGGIYDHLGGGFHRYSTDRYWLLPHFEKMLYDQGMLIFAYTDGYKLLKKELYREVVESTVRYLEREMVSPEGGFYSSQDADSEGEEGKYYTWSIEELKQVLTSEELELAIKVFNLEEEGNYYEEATGRKTGRNILHMNKELKELAKELNIDIETLKVTLESIKRKLFEAREKRVKPPTDTKILTDWNGLVIAALAYAGRTFDRNDWVALAKKAADFLLEKMVTPSGKVFHRYAEGEVRFEGNLDDYVYLLWGLCELYAATLEDRYLEIVPKLVEHLINHFWDKENGGFYLTSDYATDVPLRKKEFYDGAIPSGNSVAVYTLLRLGRILGKQEWEKYAEKTLQAMAEAILKAPIGYTFALVALDLLVNSLKTVYIVPTEEDNEYLNLLRWINENFLPDVDYVVLTERLKEISEFLRNLKGGKKTCYYLCRNFVCEQPKKDWKEVKEAIKGLFQT
jgi:uncharacterized protein YyaL (SSP411 family)